jgi:hypothetical protein
MVVGRVAMNEQELRELRGRFRAALAVALERTGNEALAEQIMNQLARAADVRWVGGHNLVETYGATGTHGGIVINPAGVAALEKFIEGMHTGITHGVWRSDWSGGRQEAHREALRRGATDAQGQEIALALGDDEIDSFLSGTHTGVLYGVTSQPQAPVFVDGGGSRYEAREDARDAAAAWGGGSRGAGAYESELAEIMRRFAEQDEQARIDEINRLAIEQKRWEEQFAFEQSQWEQQYGLEQLAYDLQAAEAERRVIESMSTPFASLMGQFQRRAPDEPVTLTPGVGAALRGAGIPVTGVIQGEPVTVTANQVAAGGGQLLRDLMTNMGARHWEALITDPMEVAQTEVLAEVGGMGKLPYMQGLRNRVIAERPVGPSRFA